MDDIFYDPFALMPEDTIHYVPQPQPIQGYSSGIFGWQPGLALDETRKTMYVATGAIVVLILLIAGLAVVLTLKKK